jgi:hypothetical protein
VDWIHLAQDKDQWRGSCNTSLGPKNVRGISGAIIRFSRGTVLHGVNLCKDTFINGHRSIGLCVMCHERLLVQ